MTAYETILARSFSRHEQKNFGYGALISCFVMSFTLGTVFKQYLIGAMPIMNLGLPIKMLFTTDEIYESRQSYTHPEITANPIFGNLTNTRSQVYELNGDIRIHGNSSTIFVASTQAQNRTYNFTTKPYARKTDKDAMGKVRSLKIINQPLDNAIIPHCTRNFSDPAIVFSTGGYAGNHFHDFTDILIPLYSTSRQYNGTVIFLVTDKHSWWISKYKQILDKLSNYEVIDIDNEKEVLCFSRMIVGLKANKELSIDPSKSPHYSVTDFTKFLKSTYSLKRTFLNDSRLVTHKRRPRLLIVSRQKTRHLRNEAAVADLARSLGFEVDVREMGSRVSSVAKFMNTFDAMIGVHGAGLTNMVFLPENAIVIQIIPIGAEFLGKDYFQHPAKDMKLRYLEYKVDLKESSLLGRYPLDSQVYRDPVAVQEKGWHDFRSVYLDNQDLYVDLCRFRKTLVKAFKLINS